jgi:hypothetical protein
VKFLLLVYVDHDLIAALPRERFDAMMRECLLHADELKAQGVLLDSQQLELPPAARTLRTREEKLRVMDGPFAETKEYLGGFNLIEARDATHAERLASEFPWTRIGSIEVRPVRDIARVREQVGA